jgi:hypothetical protein
MEIMVIDRALFEHCFAYVNSQSNINYQRLTSNPPGMKGINRVDAAWLSALNDLSTQLKERGYSFDVFEAISTRLIGLSHLATNPTPEVEKYVRKTDSGEPQPQPQTHLCLVWAMAECQMDKRANYAIAEVARLAYEYYLPAKFELIRRDFSQYQQLGEEV